MTLMPEPDFDQIARRIAGVWGDSSTLKPMTEAIAEQLRLIWNARGAADVARLEAELSSMMGVTAAGPYVKNLERALQTLDK